MIEFPLARGRKETSSPSELQQHDPIREDKLTERSISPRQNPDELQRHLTVLEDIPNPNTQREVREHWVTLRHYHGRMRRILQEVIGNEQRDDYSPRALLRAGKVMSGLAKSGDRGFRMLEAVLEGNERLEPIEGAVLKRALHTQRGGGPEKFSDAEKRIFLGGLGKSDTLVFTVSDILTDERMLPRESAAQLREHLADTRKAIERAEEFLLKELSSRGLELPASLLQARETTIIDSSAAPEPLVLGPNPTPTKRG